MPTNLENSAGGTELEKVSFHSNPKEGQCQIMLKLLHNCIDFTYFQGNAQNPSSKISTVWELRTSRRVSSVQFSHSVMSNSLWPHGLQHARPPCPSPSTGAYSNSCAWSQLCHPTTSSSVIPFSHLQSFPASGSFQMNQFFATGGHKEGWAQGNPLTLLVGMQTSTATMENSVEIP